MGAFFEAELPSRHMASVNAIHQSAVGVLCSRRSICLVALCSRRKDTRILPCDHGSAISSALPAMTGPWLKSNCAVQGSLVRAVRRVEEVLRQATAGAQVMGELQLVELFEECQRRIKRDIVFAASLYL